MTIQQAIPSAYSQLTTIGQWENLIESLGLRSGIYGDPAGTACQGSLDTGGRNADLAAGQAVIKGRFWSTDATVATAIPAASSQDRIDRLVLRMDRNAGSEATVIQPVVITGTPGSSPVPPAVSYTATGFYDVKICSWTSKAGGALTGLTDERTFRAAGVPVCTSASRPDNFVTRGLALETDTGKVIYWSGTAWSYLAPDGLTIDDTNHLVILSAGWRTVATDPVNGGAETWHALGLSSGWTSGDDPAGNSSPPKYKLLPTGDVALMGTVHTKTSGSILGITFATVPAPYRPPVLPLIGDAQSFGGLHQGFVVVNTDGTMQLQGDFSNNQDVSLTGVLPWTA